MTPISGTAGNTEFGLQNFLCLSLPPAISLSRRIVWEIIYGPETTTCTALVFILGLALG